MTDKSDNPDKRGIVFFDESLPRFAKAIREALGEDSLRRGVIVRDNSGRLSFVADTPAPSNEASKEIENKLNQAIGSYARPDRVLAFRDDYGANRLLIDPARFPITVDKCLLQLIDRRIVGAAWLDAPKEQLFSTPRIVFASLKGGVGRSTALAITAADLARRNKNVLVVDLDLEAPGLGEFLLTGERTPLLGAVDFLVENGISTIEDSQLKNFLGTSELTTGGGGRVDVIPAFGSISHEHPENVLSKLARAMIEDVRSDGTTVSVVAQMSGMIERFGQAQEYDVILVDSRAGLAELAAPAIVGLGASVLLFSTAQKQSIEGYRALFAALKLLAQRDRAGGKDALWRSMFKAVHAKASLDPISMASHRDDLYELFADFLYDAEEAADSSDQGFSFNINDSAAPHWPLIIPFNSSFAELDFAKNANQLTQHFYEQTFRQFMDGIDAIIEGENDDSAVAN